MDLIVGLPMTQGGNNTLWVIVDRLTMTAHFLPIKDTFTNQLGKIDCLTVWNTQNQHIR